MPLYRIHSNLQVEAGRYYGRGEVSELKEVSPKGIETLLGREVISIIRTPPLSILPGWEEVSVQLLEYQIEDVEDLLTTSEEQISDLLEVEVEKVIELKEEAKKYLFV